MGHPDINNRTPFAFEPVFEADEEGRPVLVTIVKATYSFDARGLLVVAEKQVSVKLAGEYWGEPGRSSCRYEPEGAFFKPATDVVLIGHGYPPDPRTTQFGVSLSVGTLQKTVRVVGDRFWVRSLGSVSPSPAQAFEKMPLVYERAFGGWDKRDPDPAKHSFEPRNPVGMGFRARNAPFEEGTPLPNLEDSRRQMRAYGETPEPACFGFVSPDWTPRAALAGTYDAAWAEQRMPLLPKDFKPSFFNAASPGLVAGGFLRGDEPVLLENGSQSGRLSMRLPGVPPPVCTVRLRGGDVRTALSNLDTVIINTDESLLLLFWRGRVALRNGPHDVLAIEASASPRSKG